MQKIPPAVEEKGAPPVPDAVRPANSANAAGCAVAATLILLPVVLYLGFFGAILVDELVLGTSYIGRNLPKEAKDVAEFIYAPLFFLVESMGIQI
ncbi:MAG TPA: hypothetical protein VGN57_10960 [Pirellulaceae bacterium]|jgi:hypothetical protein|nr:hypothetical protein [Pirellulaceae bacterium]